MIRTKEGSRICKCGCGLEVTKTWALYRPECYKRREHERNVARGKTRVRPERELPPRPQPRAQLRRGDPNRIPTKHCKTCGGQSWRRPEHRPCTCGERYAAERKPERGSILCSSAGTMRQANAVFGSF